MKKLMLTLAASAAVVTGVYATPNWFDGNIGGTASGGSWTVPSADVTLDTNKYVLDDPETALTFAATETKSVSSSQNLSFATSAKFSYSYDELPVVPTDAKAGVIVYGENYYVLAKDGETNAWTATEITASLDENVNVGVVVSNGASAVYAIYTIGTATIEKEVVASGAWGNVEYLGCGEVASLTGETVSLGYVIPGGGTIDESEADAWATQNSIDISTPEKKQEFIDNLASTTVYVGNRTFAESVILGVATNAEINTTIVDTGIAANRLSFNVDCSPLSDHDVAFVLKKNGTQVGESQSTTSFNVDFGDGEYTIIAYIDGANKEIPVSKTIGVKSIAAAAAAASTTTYLSVPYAGDEGDIAIAELFKKALLTEGDQIDVWDADEAKYLTYVYNGSGWSSETGAPTTIKCGQAFKFTRPATVSGTPAFLGYVADTASTSVSKGTTKWNLVGAPSGSVAVSKLPLDTKQARAVVLDGDNATKVLFKVGNTVYSRSGWNGSLETVSGEATVEGGFFLKTSESTSIEW